MSDQISMSIPQTLAREGQRLDHVARDDAVDALLVGSVDPRTCVQAHAGTGGHEGIDVTREDGGEDVLQAPGLDGGGLDVEQACELALVGREDRGRLSPGQRTELARVRVEA